MFSLTTEFTPVDRPDPAFLGADIGRAGFQPPRAEPARVIEVGAVTAGIAVPEGRSVRFFSSSRAFDALDGAVFRNTAQAARAARERVRGRAGQPRPRDA